VGLIDLTEVQAWAREGGALARSYFNNVQREQKADRSYVTRADREVEQLLRERIAARYPDHGIIGEEEGVGAIDREFVWALDPIDGTGAFVSGLPLWCVSIGILRHGEPYAGVIYAPLLDDCYWADVEGQAFRNTLPIAVCRPAPIDTNDWIAVPSTVHRMYRIRYPGKTRCLGTVAADCCYVARGAAVSALIDRARLWDLAAGLAILRAAGGTVIGLSGAPVAVPPLLSGRRLREPILIGHPETISQVRGYIEAPLV
jgi:fructose-1,6-bisphosphatase/inositol monophosphatase family enzyme